MTLMPECVCDSAVSPKTWYNKHFSIQLLNGLGQHPARWCERLISAEDDSLWPLNSAQMSFM